MKQLLCPLNGLRNISEFSYGGEYHPMPDPDCAETRAWAEYVFFHDNSAGLVVEWWCHIPTSYWFLAERDTRTDEVTATFKPGNFPGFGINADDFHSRIMTPDTAS